MKEQIIQHIDDPEMLETLFNEDKTSFVRDFSEASSGVDTDLVKFWQIRLKSMEHVRQNPSLKKGW
ncbi:hypothetical protein ACFLS7_00900 [Bacteroidota bacterium]